MSSTPKTYEGTEYVSHTIESVPLRRAPTKRWQVEVITKIPEGMEPLPFGGLLDIPVPNKPKQVDTLIDKFAEGMRKRWNKRTSADDGWIEGLKADLKKVVDEG